MSKNVRRSWWFLCTQLTCEHFFKEFVVIAKKKPVGYVACPKCGCSGEYNGLAGYRLIDMVKGTYLER